MCSTKLSPLASWQSPLNLGQATELQAEAAPGLLGRQPGPEILLHLLLEMELQLLIDLLGNGGAAEERAKTNAKVAEHLGRRLLSCFQNLGDCKCQLLPGAFLDLEVFMAGLGQLVVFGAAIVV